MTPVVAFYMLVDWDRMVRTVDSWMPVRQRETIRAIAHDIDRAIAGFVRGQALVCLILGTFYAVGLSVIGLNFGALIGMTAGLLSFIPYVGSLTGLILSMGVAIVQFWPDWTMILATLGIFVFGQFVEGNILSPKLVGESVGLHPVWLMFALLAFGALFGFVGLLLAVPLAAAIGRHRALRPAPVSGEPALSGSGPTIIKPRVDDKADQCLMRPSSWPSTCRWTRVSAREDFLVSPSNEQAYGLIESWPEWPDTILLLIGPRGSGKSHLASIWATNAHAWTVDASEITRDKVPHLVSNGALAIEDMDRGARDEAALFHLLNLAAGEEGLRC